MSYQNKNGPSGRSASPLIFIGALVILALALSPSSILATSDLCADCHEEVSAAFSNTMHGQYFGDDPDKGCESCHGSGVEHANEGDPELIINPGNHDQFGGKELCLSCHTDHRFDNWAFSSHNTADVTCADCHKAHVEGPVKKDCSYQCYDCHADVRAATQMPSHHPIEEGKMSCNSCHGVHGEDASLAMDGTTQELCYTCHAEKEGPFIFEHAPVYEDCMICHSPHGTVADNLLKQSEPTLCLNCHAMHFHTTADGEVQDDFQVVLAPDDRYLDSSPESWKAGMLTKCTQCHIQVHGSDLPSKEIPNGGNALTR